MGLESPRKHASGALPAERRPTLTVGGPVLWAGLLDEVERRKQAGPSALLSAS